MKHSLKLFLTGLVTTTSISLVSCDEHLGSGSTSTSQQTNIQNTANDDTSLKATHCFYPDDDSCGNMTMVALDNSSTGIHQVMKGNYDKGNVVALDTPMLMTFIYDQPWNAHDVDQYINYNFGYNWNLKKDSVKITFTDTPESGCLIKTTIAPSEICYMYATIHMEPEDTTLEPKRNLVSASTRFTEHKGTITLFQLSTTFRYEDVSQSLREVMSWESQYLSQITQKLPQYKVIKLQNISANPSKILEIQPNGIYLESGLDSIFKIQHRQMAGYDPIYGNMPECTTPDKVDVQRNQVSSLARSAECTIVYSVPDDVEKADTYQDSVIINTNAPSSPNRNPDLARYAPSSFDRPASPKMVLTATYKANGEKKLKNIEWHQSDINSGNFYTITHANNLWVAVGASGVYWSEDGKHWMKSNVQSMNAMSIEYGGNLWVVSGGNNIYWSKDGKLWSKPNGIIGAEDIHYVSNIWVAGGINGIYTSNDGITWSAVNKISINSISYADGVWVAVGGSKNGVFWSINGKDWNSSNIASGATLFWAYYNDNIWVLAGTSGLYWSKDGKSWTISNKVGNFYTSRHASGIWVAIGNSNNGLYWSIDGKLWNSAEVMPETFNDAYSDGRVWVAGSQKNLYLSNDDGKKWIKDTSILDGITSIYYDAGLWVVSGSSKGIFYGVPEYYNVTGKFESLSIKSVGN